MLTASFWPAEFWGFLSSRFRRLDKSMRPVCGQGAAIMGDKGKKDKGKREDQKKAVLSPKEKRKAKIEKNSAK
jgi:hypothetical protein